jgi:membrane associated rhomboid family serine protease
MVGIIAIIWLIQVANWADHGQLAYHYGIVPRDVGSLPYILTAPFLHFGWTHIEGNSGPLFIFGFLAAYRGLAKFAAVTVVVVLTSGLAAWFFEPAGSVGAGASGVVFGYFGYIMVRGLFDRHVIDVIIGAVMALCFAYQFSVLLPHQGIGWQAHVGGIVGGVASGWLFRDRRAASAVTAGRSASSVSTSAATAIQPPGRAAALTQQNKGQHAKSGGKGFEVDPSNPRADLYKQLDDMGL